MTETKTACALLVQLVERRSPKPDVGGSSPPGRAQKPKIQPETRTHLLVSQLMLIISGIIIFGFAAFLLPVKWGRSCNPE
jgi:hypothetical protein